MKSAAVTLKPSDSVLAAIRVFVSKKARYAVVVDKRALVGIVSESDLLRAVARGKAEKLHVRDIMTANTHTVGPDEHYVTLALRLIEERIGALPVMRGARLVGVVTVADVLAEADRELGAKAKTLRGKRKTFA